MCKASGSIEGRSLQKHKKSCSAFYVTSRLALSVAKANGECAGEGRKNRLKHVIASRIISQPLTAYGLGTLAARRSVLALGEFFSCEVT